jgi:hypothetical protein
VAYRETRVTRAAVPHQIALILEGIIIITMEDYSDSDTSSESEYESRQGSAAGSDCGEDEHENLEPEPSKSYDEYENALWNPAAQLHAVQLAQLHADIKARAELLDPTYKKLSWSWPIRPFDVRILPDHVQHPIHFFELFWGQEIWSTLMENTNAYAQYKEARHKENKRGGSWWKAVTLYEMRIFIALLIYIGIVSASNISSY